jgi:4-diphosphocytidyl-2-C-methyl-D-erythritol kinase
MRLLAPAKLNLFLRVGPRAADGFHPLLSWMCTAGLFDTLEIDRADNGISLRCDDPNLACDQRNLVVRATLLLSEGLRVGSDTGKAGVAVLLRKRIPMGSGLGGGSSDAARMLCGLVRLWGLEPDHHRLADVAARLGSDVPFFLHQPSAICRGRGEIVEPIAPPAPSAALLILPGFALPTADVYRRFDEMGLGRAESLEDRTDWSANAALRAVELLPRLVNDLEPAAFSVRPELDELRRQCEQLLGRPVRMSGSGSALFTLYDQLDEATRAAASVGERLRLRVEPVELAPTLRDDLNSASGPR